MLVDSHIHLGRHEFAADRAEVVARAVAAGVARFLEVGYDPSSSEAAARLAATDPRIDAAVGVHPHDAALLADADGRLTDAGRALLDRLAALARQPGVVAVGEIGLDFYRDLSPRPAQAAAFRAQLELAARCDLPVVLHVRDAYAETVALLEAHGLPRRRGVFHSFAGDEATARWAVARGFRLGIGGPVTYRISRLPAVVAAAGPDALLLETDAPWLPPHPHRGRRNEPAWLGLTAAAVATACGTTVEDVARRTTAGYHATFPTRGTGAAT